MKKKSSLSFLKSVFSKSKDRENSSKNPRDKIDEFKILIGKKRKEKKTTINEIERQSKRKLIKIKVFLHPKKN